MTDLVERLRAPDSHDPSCPFKQHCYCDDSAPHDNVSDDDKLEAADRIETLEAGGLEATLGVGDGGGQLFVHGSYDAIKRVQQMILELERLRLQRELGNQPRVRMCLPGEE